jgi:hypothetical protein
MYFATVGCETVMPSFSSSPWMRGAPHSGFARLICRMRSRTSFGTAGRPVLRGRDFQVFGTAGRPVLRGRDFQVQKSRKPLRDQATTVSGLTMMSGILQLGQANPKDTTGRSEMRALRPSVLQNGELLAKGEDLERPP